MLPHPSIPPLELADGVVIYAFDVCVAVAVMVGVWVGERRAQSIGLDRRVLLDVSLWAVIPGFIASHLYSLIFYFPERVVADPWVLLNIFGEMSSFGGFIGGACGVIFYFRLKKIPFWPYSDPLAFGFTVAWIFGRLGCTLAFDHPGLITEFPLGMPYGGSADLEAGVRHNLGFYEFLWALGISIFFLSQYRRAHFAGWHVVVFLISYTPIRFAGDFLRAVDKRYLGLTPGQYAALALGAVGIWWWTIQGRGEITHANGEIHIFQDGRPGLAPRHEPAAPPADEG
ncbi:MAG: prolipoprotein diacylglyceryl transferase [Myxococcota bacterium]